jgi:hypothetical protein
LAAIFQRSPAVILVARRADISSVSELRGRTLMDTQGSDEIAAMLKHEGVDYAALPRVAHEGNPRDLLAGRADAMVAYSTSEPFVLEQLGAAYRTFSPAASGIDSYGDNLCTSEAELKAHPDNVTAAIISKLEHFMKKLTCRDFGGPCDAEFTGESFEEIGKRAVSTSRSKCKRAMQLTFLLQTK